MVKRLREIAMLTLFCFCWGILTPALVSGQETAGLDEARRLVAQGQPDKAREMLDSLINQWTGKPESKQSLADAYVLRAKIYMQAADTAKCEADVRQALSAQPNYVIAVDDQQLLPIIERIRAEAAAQPQAAQKSESNRALTDIPLPGPLAREEQNLTDARQLYKTGQFDKAKMAIASLIGRWTGKAALVELLTQAYLLRVNIAIAVLTQAQAEAEADLRQMFSLQPNLAIFSDNAEFKTLVERLRAEEAQKRQEQLQKEALAKAQAVEQEGKVEPKKKSFPWILVAAGAVVVIALIFILLAKKSYTLTVTVSSGVSGTPVSGTASYTSDQSVTYNYTLQSGYKDLVVKIDGVTASASGTIAMTAAHTLTAQATRIVDATLTVTMGAGINGTPAATTTYPLGTDVIYTYSLLTGYKDLVVKLDGNTVTASGDIVMNADHALSITATAVPSYTLTVIIHGNPAGEPRVSGTYTEGTVINYWYSGRPTIYWIKIDGVNQTYGAGTLIMNRDHSIEVSGT